MVGIGPVKANGFVGYVVAMPPWCEFGRVIGEGSTGRVVEGKLSNGVTIAVKCTTRGRLPFGDGYFYHEEVDVLKRCSDGHPNIVKLLVAVSDRSYFYIGMERVYGENPKIGAKREVAAGIVHALEHMRDVGVVHRDVSARNILVDDQTSFPVLVDYGFAARINVSPLRTPSLLHAPPELLLRADIPPHPAEDLYALGKLFLDLYPTNPNAISLSNVLTVRLRIPKNNHAHTHTQTDDEIKPT